MSEKAFVIIIPSYNNINYYKRNINSALSQNYSNYRIIYQDDCSPDGTGQAVEDFLGQNSKVKLIRNQKRQGALKNIYEMVHSCQDDEIIVTLDGDDWLAHSNVLTKLNQVYQEDVWMTYGQYRSFPDNRIGCSQQTPQNIIDNALYRSSQWRTSHLRTFYTWLFKQIKEEDLKHNGEFFPSAWDLPLLYPMLELSGNRQKFISDVLYIYNTETPINDSKVNLQLQQSLERVARSMPKYKLLLNRP